MDAILRQVYVRQHVERYAQHVMALSPLSQPPELGVDLRSPAVGAVGETLGSASKTVARCVRGSRSGRREPGIRGSQCVFMTGSHRFSSDLSHR